VSIQCSSPICHAPSSSYPCDPSPEQDEIADALERIIAGPEKKGAVMSEKKKRLVAYHEAGHALVRAVPCRYILGVLRFHHPSTLPLQPAHKSGPRVS